MRSNSHRSLVVSVALASSLALWPRTGLAHDASSWGGLFRSRDDGATWFQASLGKVMGSALAIAVDPRQPTRLWLGTDSGLLESRNGGLDWDLVGADVLVGPVLAVAISGQDRAMLAASGSLLAASSDGVRWQSTTLPVGAAPVRGLVAGGSAGTFYLLGWQGLFRTEDGGGTWSELDAGLPERTATHLLFDPRTPTALVAVAGGDVWMSRDGGRHWEVRHTGLPGGQVQTVALDPRRADGLWAAGANAVFASDDAGSTWRRVGNALPEAGTDIRGIAVGVEDEARIVLSTQRGLYASRDGAITWELLADNLPGHIDAGPLEREHHESATLYAGFSVTPYEESWRSAAAGGSPLSRLAASEVFGAAAFVALLGFAARPFLALVGAQIATWRTRDWEIGAMNAVAAVSSAHRLRPIVLAALALLVLGAAALGWRSTVGLDIGSDIGSTEYRVPGAQDIPAAIAIAPDGAIWFTLESSGALGVLRDGEIRTVSRGGGETIEALGLAVDASGAWFTDITGQSIGHLAPDGSRDSVPVPGPLAQLGRLALAPDGAVWFADSWGNSFTRISEGRLTPYPVRESNAAPFGVAVDERGTVWGTLQVANKVVRIDPDGAHVELEIPTRNSTPTDIAVDGSGGVWFTELRSNRIAHFANGRFDEFDVPTPAAGLTSLAVAQDGSVWFTELRNQKLARFRNGSFAEWALPRPDARPFGVSIDRQGDVWYTDLSGWVGRVPAKRAQADWIQFDLRRIVTWLRG